MSKIEKRLSEAPLDELWRIYRGAKRAVADEAHTARAMNYMHSEKGRTHMDLEKVRSLSERIATLASAELVRRGEIGTEN
jgi:hypothetical protein